MDLNVPWKYYYEWLWLPFFFCKFRVLNPSPSNNSIFNMRPYKLYTSSQMFNGKIFLIWDKAKNELVFIRFWKSQFKNLSGFSPTNLKYLFTQSLPILSSTSFPIDILQLLWSKCIFLFPYTIYFVLETISVKYFAWKPFCCFF